MYNDPENKPKKVGQESSLLKHLPPRFFFFFPFLFFFLNQILGVESLDVRLGLIASSSVNNPVGERRETSEA